MFILPASKSMAVFSCMCLAHALYSCVVCKYLASILCDVQTKHVVGEICVVFVASGCGASLPVW